MTECVKKEKGPCGGVRNSRVCSDAVRYVQKELQLPPKAAIIACEGGCIKGEVARIAANMLGYGIVREQAIRICLGDAATGDSGMVELIRRAPKVIAIEGCPLECGTNILRKRLPDLETIVVDASQLFEFDRSKYFEIFDLPRKELEDHAQIVAVTVAGRYFTVVK